MNKETEIRLYEIAFGCNARPEQYNDVQEIDKRMSFTECDLVEKLEEYSKSAYFWEEQQEKV